MTISLKILRKSLHVNKKIMRKVACAPSTAALSSALEDTARISGFSSQRHEAISMTRADARTCPHARGALFLSNKGGWTYRDNKLTPIFRFFFFRQSIIVVIDLDLLVLIFSDFLIHSCLFFSSVFCLSLVIVVWCYGYT